MHAITFHWIYLDWKDAIIICIAEHIKRILYLMSTSHYSIMVNLFAYFIYFFEHIVIATLINE